MWWDVVLRVVGAAIVGFTLIDIGMTVVSVGFGRGPVTHYLSGAVWRVFAAAQRRLGRTRLLSFAGPVMLFGLIAGWTAGLVVGWGLVFSPEGSLAAAVEGGSIGALGRIYYAASIVVGRGSAPYQPASDAWQVVEQLAGATGVALFGLGIAYTIAVVNAVVRTRRVAAQISTLGFSAEEVLHRAWSGSDFGNLDLHLIALVPEVAHVSRLHLGFPLLFFFRSSDRRSAMGPNLAVLDDTLTSLQCCTRGAGAPTATVEPLRAAIDDFLDTLYKGFIEPLDDAPPAPELRRLGADGAGVVSDDDLDAAIEGNRHRRRLLAALVEHDGWSWSDVEGSRHDRDLAVVRQTG